MSQEISTLDGPASLQPNASIRILPAGLFRTWEGRPSGQISDWQIDATIAAKLIAAGPLSGGGQYLIDYEHQTLHKETNGQLAPAAGWFKGLEWREGEGLFMTQIEWTDRARQLIASREYRHFSPTFHYDPQTGDVTSIHSVALTNNPALVGLVDLVAATAATAASAVQDQPTEGAQLTEKDKANLLHIFGNNPGFSEAVGIWPDPPPSVNRADLNAMTERDRAKFLHMFGDQITIS